MSDRALDLLLVEDDPVFRLGLATALATVAEVTVLDAVETENALSRLSEVAQRDHLVMAVEVLSTQDGFDPLSFIQDIREQYPDVPILLLTALQDRRLLLALQALGVAAYLPKGSSIDAIASTLQQIATGETVWQFSGTPQTPSPGSLNVPKPPPRWLYNLRRLGLAQIRESLQEIEQKFDQEEQLTTLDWVFWKGRQRELKAAQWLVDQLLPVEVVLTPPDSPQSPPPQLPENEASDVPENSAIVRQPSVVEEVLNKVHFGVDNKTGMRMELDILQPDKRQELLYLAVQQWEKIIEELQFLQVTEGELDAQKMLIVRELWQNTTLEFLRKYYTPSEESVSLVDRVIRNTASLDETRLHKIPFVVDLCAYFLFASPVKIDNIPYPYDSPEAKKRVIFWLEHLLLNIANGSVQLILNEFAEAEQLKYILYERKFLSSREIARLRNDLSWQYRQYQYFGEPKAIFESQYPLFILVGNQVRMTKIYAPRLEELEQLTGLRWGVTIALEFRDAIAPRLQAIISFAGSGVVYILTQVIGRAIGLIGQGVVQGLGNTVQETRYRRKQNRN